MTAWVNSWESGAWDNIECSAQRGYVCQTYKGNLHTIFYNTIVMKLIRAIMHFINAQVLMAQ